MCGILLRSPRAAVFPWWDLYDVDLMRNIAIWAKKDVDDVDHDLSEVCKLLVRSRVLQYTCFSTRRVVLIVYKI